MNGDVDISCVLMNRAVTSSQGRLDVSAGTRTAQCVNLKPGKLRIPNRKPRPGSVRVITVEPQPGFQSGFEPG